MEIGDYCINPFVGGGIICRCLKVKSESQCELFCLESKEIIKANLYMMEPVPLSFLLNVEELSHIQRMRNIICIEIIHVGFGIMEKSKWNDFDKNLENMIASNDFFQRKEYEGIFLLPSTANVNDFFEILDKKGKSKLELVDKDTLLLGIKEREKKFSEDIDLLYMSFEPSACHYVRMSLEMYKENLIKIKNYVKPCKTM
ncbi:hypothetical protein [Capnocytophaga bilenii]|uniref:hypothetical protein n=1 Tax=Capnocytophaga bilenii TaxID=2819369 RepID=UPI0028D32B88|nr:hypothetical protein [Capnocytophaga bilenii]